MVIEVWIPIVDLRHERVKQLPKGLVLYVYRFNKEKEVIDFGIKFSHQPNQFRNNSESKAIYDKKTEECT